MMHDGKTDSLFRIKALQAVYETNEVQDEFEIIPPNGWLWLFAVLLMMIGVLLWLLAGKITFSVSASGILLPQAFLQETEKKMAIAKVERQKKFARLDRILAAKRSLYHQRYLSLMDLERAEQEYSLAKKEIMTGLRQAGSVMEEYNFNDSGMQGKGPISALIFIESSQAKNLAVGMPVRLFPMKLSPLVSGYIRGSITRLSAFPVTRELAYAYLGNHSLVDQYFAVAAPFMAVVAVSDHSAGSSGFSWIRARDAPRRMDPGTSVNASIRYRIVTPVKSVFAS